MAQDYIMRMIEQIGMIIAGIVRSRNAGRLNEAGAEIDRQCLEQVGLPIEMLRQMPPAELENLLGAGGGLKIPKSILVGELMAQDAELALIHGNPPSAAIGFGHAYHLIRGSIEHLSHDDRSHYDDRLAEIAAKLWDLDAGPKDRFDG